MTRGPGASLRAGVVRRLARPYVAGPSAADAVAVGRAEVAAAAGAEVTIGRWAGPREDPAEVLSAHRDALAAIVDTGLPATVSIKLPDLGYEQALVLDLLGEAHRQGVGVHLDSMHPDSAGPTMAMLPALVATHPGLGCTLAGRWERSVEDAHRALDLGVRSIRVVKGQWADPTDPRRDPRAGVLTVLNALRGAEVDRGVDVGVATHDTALAVAALDRLTGSGTGCHLEQLYGPPRPDVAALRERFGVGLVVYVPFGAAYLPYALRAALRHPRVAARAARDLVRAAPAPRGRQRGGITSATTRAGLADGGTASRGAPRPMA